MRTARSKANKKSGAKIFVIVLFLLIIIAGILLAIKVFKGKENCETANVDDIISNENNRNIIRCRCKSRNTRNYYSYRIFRRTIWNLVKKVS